VLAAAGTRIAFGAWRPDPGGRRPTDPLAGVGLVLRSRCDRVTTCAGGVRTYSRFVRAAGSAVGTVHLLRYIMLNAVMVPGPALRVTTACGGWGGEFVAKRQLMHPDHTQHHYAQSRSQDDPAQPVNPPRPAV
jgi:hypothetical protein